MTVRDVKSYLSELHDADISSDLITRITDAVIEEVNEWRNSSLDKIYPIVFIDGFVAIGLYMLFMGSIYQVRKKY